MLGDLPTKVDEITSYAVPTNLIGEGVNSAPSELLVYTFITSKGAAWSLLRAYYIVSTRKLDGTQFNFFMNAPLSPGTVANSQNFWLPYGADFEPYVYVELNSAPPGTELPDCSSDGWYATLAKQNLCLKRILVGSIALTGYKV